MAKTKRVDPIKQREKRAKIAAGVGGLLFLVVAAIEIPPVLKSGAPPPSASRSTTTTPSTSTTSSSATAAAPAPAAGELADTDAPPPVEPGELVSFSMFQSKNPFAPQVTTPETTTTTTTPTAAPPPPTTTEQQGADAAGTSTLPTTTTTVPAAGSTGSTGVVPAPPATAAPSPTVAISVNGSVSRIETDGTFPEASPVFRLVSYADGTAEVAIVGGSYAAGGATLTLHLHTPVTLENQTDGKRYTLELDSTP